MGDTPARIIRTIHDQQNRFFLFSRETAQNTSLSYEALGVLAYLLSKPDDWTVRVSDLQKRAHGKKAHYGRGAIAAIMQELRTAGYAELKPIRDAKTGIVSGTEYWIYETPRPAETTEQPDFRRSEKPTVEKPASIEDTDSLQETEKDIAPNGAGAKKPSHDGKSTAKKQTVPASEINPMKDAIVRSFGYSWDTMTKSEKGLVQATARELCLANAAPEQVAIVYAHCKARFTHFSPKALATHYSEVIKSTAAKPAAAPVQDAYSAWRAQTMADEARGGMNS